MITITLFFFPEGSFEIVELVDGTNPVETRFHPSKDAFTEIDSRYVLPENQREAIRDTLARHEAISEPLAVQRR